MSTTFAADVSYYQPYVNDKYRRPWFIFRVCDGTFVDPHFAGNFAWSANAVQKRRAGLLKPRLKGFTVYAVFEPGVDVVAVAKAQVEAALAKLPAKRQAKARAKLTFMLDVESWNGKISGDHSPEIRGRLNDAAAWLGSHRRVIAYANLPDFAALFPSEPAWCHLVVAGYSSVRPSHTNMIGWQFSDGETRWPVPAGYPRASAPFGNCDHNEFLMSPAELATLLGVGGAAVKPKPVPPTPKPDPKPAPKPDGGPNIDAARDALHKASRQHRKAGPVRRAVLAALKALRMVK
jgi:hypothetical protein